jgi:hypothetical protein
VRGLPRESKLRTGVEESNTEDDRGGGKYVGRRGMGEEVEGEGTREGHPRNWPPSERCGPGLVGVAVAARTRQK